jgi:hypothetical protein
MSNARNIADAGHQLVAWVNYNQKTNTINASFGTISILDVTTGVFKVTILEQPDAYYVISCTLKSGALYTRGITSESGSSVDNAAIADPTTTEFYIKTASGNSRYDCDEVCVMVFR